MPRVKEFMQMEYEPDAESAFSAAKRAALHENGFGGFTGSVAEKNEFVVISEHALSAEDADALAERLMRARDGRIADPAGPAGAIPIAEDGSKLLYRGAKGMLALDGDATSVEIERLAAAAVVLKPGEQIIRVNIIENKPTAKVLDESTKAKPKSTFVVTDTATGDEVARFASLGEAKKAVRELLGQSTEARQLVVNRVFIREDSTPLISMRKAVIKRRVRFAAEISRPSKAKTQGWVFFGVAPSA